MDRVLIVEDEPDIAGFVYKKFKNAGYETSLLTNGNGVLSHVISWQPDIIILDLMLPDKDGLTCAKEIREISNTPIIMLTAKVSDIDRIIGLQAGADDYVCKPFNAKELLLRTQAVLKRITPVAATGALTLNSQVLTYHSGQSVKLTRSESSLFQLLSGRPGRIFSRQEMMTLAYPDGEDVNDRAVDSHIKNLRKKIRSLGIISSVIESIYGAGYQYIEPDSKT